LYVATTFVGPVIEQLVPSGTLAPVAVTIITSPDFPSESANGPVRVIAVRETACACLGGVVTEATETRSAEVRSSTINSEPELRLVNLRHAVMMSLVRHI
jgi:hypothetical protein